MFFYSAKSPTATMLVFYLGLALDPKYVEGFVEGCLERVGEDEPEGAALFRDLGKDEGERETVHQILQAECEVLPGRPPR